MYQFTRYHHVIIRYILFGIFILPLIKLTSIYYYDLQQQQSIDSSSLSLPFDIEEKKSIIINRSMNSTDQILIESYRQFVRKINDEQFMYNKHLFSSNNTHYILLVQVHTRIVYLQKFIQMLKYVETINETLVIFSHDFIDLNINALIQNITFAPVIQIFYPFSQQLYPNEFPGLDPNDCPRDIPRYQALTRRCNNAAYPDQYGHYREASIVQIKHHWWWKLNFVFNSIEVLRNRTDYLLLLLEEDFYLSPDALNFLRKMETEKSKLCPDCAFFTLGNFERYRKKFPELGSKISIARWHARYNLGMTISHSIWMQLVKYAEEFCTTDDYNWDWTLVSLAQKRFGFPRVMWSSATRVMHLGSCGIHHKKTCSNERNIAQWKETKKFYRENQKYLFPTVPLSIHGQYVERHLIKQLNGGWSDIRDQLLCLSFAFKDTRNLSSIDINRVV